VTGGLCDRRGEGTMNKYPHLFQPGHIGTLEIKNRIVMAPMGITGPLTGHHGTFSDRAITVTTR
jgi:2,4-dienoyl-CoA reductase-like NADH-dependent reductase (Old Yellow Enzyme family)